MNPWQDVPFLVDSYRRAFNQAHIETYNFAGDFSSRFKKSITPYIEEWTSDPREQRLYLQDLMDEALDSLGI